MGNFDLSTLTNYAITFGVKVLAAFAMWVVGRWLIRMVIKSLGSMMSKNEVDSTLQRYLVSVLTVALNIVLVIGILGYFGIQTASFAAILAAGAFAIGAAWSGLLANFAAGAFMVILRPFKVGDFVQAGGTMGTVTEIGLFATTINTMDNVLTIVGNNKIFSDSIQNFTTNPFRRVDRTAQIAHEVNPVEAMNMLREELKKIPNVAQTPEPEIEILEFNERGSVLAVRPFVHNDHYWQVYFDTNKLIAEKFGTLPIPEARTGMRNI